MSPRRRRPSLRRAAITPAERVLVAVVSAAAAVGGALAGAHPTAHRSSDVVLTAAFAALVALAASIARTWTWIVIAAVAAAFSRGGLQAAGFALELVTIGSAVRDVPARRVVGAVVGGGAAQLLLRLGGGPFLASTALVAAIATAPVLVSAWQVARTRTRTIVRRSALVLGGMAALATLAAAFSLVQARSATNQALSRVRAGLDAARQGDTARAGAELARAADLFSTAHDSTRGFWARPAELVPVVGQQVASVDRLTGAGQTVTAVAAKATTRADVSGFRLRGGTIDVQKIADAQQPLREVLDSLGQAQRAIDASQSDWLVQPLASRIASFEAQVRRATDEGETAQQVAAVAPALLGAGAPRHYFVIFANPAETRDLGGILGGWGELVADNGRLSLRQTGAAADLGTGPRTLTDPSAFTSRFRSQLPQVYWANLPAAPDFPTVAEVVRQLWPQSPPGAASPPLDGVLYIDPYALAALLKLTGPVDAPQLGVTLDENNIVPFLLRDQYLQLTVPDERHDLLSKAAKTVFDKVTSVDLPGPRQLADALGPVAQQGRLLLHSFRPADQALFARLGIDGALPPVDGDYLGFTTSNAGANKIDSYLSRAVGYDVKVDPSTGAVDATVRIDLGNGAPAGGLPPYIIGNDRGLPTGTNTLVAAVYSPLALQSATLDGQPVAAGANTEYGRKVYVVGIDIPPGGRRTLELRLSGMLPLDHGYRLTVAPQAAVGVEHLTLRVQPTAGWKATALDGMLADGPGAVRDEDLPSDRSYRLHFGPS